MLDPDRYCGMDRPRLVIRFVEVTTSLTEVYTQLHTAKVALTKAKFDSYNRNPTESEAAKKRISDQDTHPLQEAVDDLETQVLVHQEERDMLRLLLEMQNHHVK